MTGAMRMCRVCGTRPPAMREIPCCFECWPGGPVTPPPCRRCGSREDYYTSGLCARCHTRAPGQRSAVWKTGATVVVASCRDCFGWGVTRTYRWLCPGCKAWRDTYPAGTCAACGRLIAVGRDGTCRLCRKHRGLLAAIADLPAPMRQELGIWFDIMHNGSTTPPRSRPRSETTVGSQLRWALPALRQWAVQHESLREIGRDDVLAVLPPSGTPRACMRQGLRSIFGTLKGRRLVFVNPAARISAPQPARQAPAAVDLETLRAALDSADPARAVLASLLAFHAVRIYQLCALRLTDVRDGRLHIAGQVIPLAGPVRQRLARYLDFRQQTWPDSVNPYLFLHVRNADAARHVTPQWIRHQLGMSGQRIRLDRIFDEAQATGGDLRALCDLFGLSIAGAYRYTSVLDRIDYPTRTRSREPS